MARAHTHQNIIVKVTRRNDSPEVVSIAIEVSALSIIILAYSAIKIIEKRPAAYSTLNPETSSLSPSAKSKGVRLLSLKQTVSQTKKVGLRMRSKKGEEEAKWVLSERPAVAINNVTITREKGIS